MVKLVFPLPAEPKSIILAKFLLELFLHAQNEMKHLNDVVSDTLLANMKYYIVCFQL